MRIGREALHIGPDRGDHCSNGRLLPSGDALQESLCLLKRGELRIDLLLHFGQGLLQEVDMSQHARDEEAMVGLHPTLQRQAQVWSFRP